jgi:hypothetical protein
VEEDYPSSSELEFPKLGDPWIRIWRKEKRKEKREKAQKERAATVSNILGREFPHR